MYINVPTPGYWQSSKNTVAETMSISDRFLLKKILFIFSNFYFDAKRCPKIMNPLFVKQKLSLCTALVRLIEREKEPENLGMKTRIPDRVQEPKKLFS
jgi:hypothetical protein